MTRSEHLQWAKDRALEYLKPGPHYSLENAVTSMLSDLRKHEELAPISEKMAPIGIFMLASKSEHDVRRFIEGFK